MGPAEILDFLDIYDDPDALYQMRLERWAEQGNLGTYPTVANNHYQPFIDKFNFYKYDPAYELNNNHLMKTKLVYDNIKARNPLGFDINDLDFYAGALRDGLLFSLTMKFYVAFNNLPADVQARYLDLLLDRSTEADAEAKKAIILEELRRVDG